VCAACWWQVRWRWQWIQGTVALLSYHLPLILLRSQCSAEFLFFIFLKNLSSRDSVMSFGHFVFDYGETNAICSCYLRTAQRDTQLLVVSADINTIAMQFNLETLDSRYYLVSTPYVTQDHHSNLWISNELRNFLSVSLYAVLRILLYCTQIHSPLLFTSFLFSTQLNSPPLHPPSRYPAACTE
jgi:hypothetical protein